MDIINVTINYLLDFAAKSEANYHVNPWLFCILFFGSALPLYYGYYRIARSALTIEDRKIKRKKIDKRGLKTGVAISIIAWWIPYVYIIVFGRLPLNVWTVFILFVLAMGIFFVRNLRGRIIDSKNKTKT